MSFASDLFTFLSTNANIIAEVSTRIYPSFTDKDQTLPYITFDKISDPPHNQMLGAAAIANPTYQFDVWSGSSLNRETVAEVLRNEMDGKRNFTMGAATAVRRIVLVGASEEIDEPTDGTQIPFFRMRMDFQFWYARAVPTL